jgi:excisionase family DNA binding protein
MNEVGRRVSISERLCLSVPEAAALLGISRNLAYEMAKQGQLPVVRFGKRLLVPKVALEKMLSEVKGRQTASWC